MKHLQMQRLRGQFGKLGRLGKLARKSRSTILQVAGCGFISAAFWVVWIPLGLAAIGASLFLLELLSDGDAK